MNKKTTNITAFIIFAVVIYYFSWFIGKMNAPLISSDIALNINNLPEYSLRSAGRIIFAMVLSFLVSVIYALLCAKNKRIERFLIPLLDILQSVPVLGYLTFTVTFFLSLHSNNILGMEYAIIFALFTAQVWNMIFSVYQSLISVPQELYEISKIYNLNKWQIFWQVELPFALPGLIWNMVLSLTSSWFFIVVSEAIAVGSQTINLPGIGAYVTLGLQNADVKAICFAILSIFVVINLINFLFIAPLIRYSYKFRYEFNSGTRMNNSWIFNLFSSATLFNKIVVIFNKAYSYMLQLKLPNFFNKHLQNIAAKAFEAIFWLFLFSCLIYVLKQITGLLVNIKNHHEILNVIYLGFLTFLRVFFILVIASLIWVPVGIYLGLKSNIMDKLQPYIQFLTALPANIYYPVLVGLIVKFNLNPNLWLSLMMAIGSQWYILYNVVAGTQAIPTELTEAADNINLRGIDRLLKLYGPAIAPFYVTGLITAAGGAWNASIIAEIITWGDKTITATGLGSYITINTNAGNFAQVTIGVLVMIAYVLLVNHILWQPLQQKIAEKFSLN